MTQVASKLDIRPVSQDELNAAFDLSREDMDQVDGYIRQSLHSDVFLINQIADYIISSGGKRLRPMLTVLSARACGYQGVDHISLAAIIEFIHTATLLHDDVVDESDMRRGQQTAHEVWGNAASVLVGDFLYSRSFQMMVQLDSMEVMNILSSTTNTIAEGEVQQLLNMGDPEVDDSRYFQVIKNKTAKLFEAACQLGAVLSCESPQVVQAMADYGNYLGCAFQIADDILDYSADAATLGKNIGDDLAEGKPTLPLIYAREAADQEGRTLIDTAIKDADSTLLPAIVELIHKTGALDKARNQAKLQARSALDALSVLAASPWKTALETLARYSMYRDH